MITTIDEFNTQPDNLAFDFQSLLQEFYSSGIKELDLVWLKPHHLYRERTKIAKKLYRSTKRQGVEAEVKLLLCLTRRLPFAIAANFQLSNGDTVSLISQLMALIVYRHTWDGDPDIVPLSSIAMEELIIVVQWHRRRVSLTDEIAQRSIFPLNTLLTCILGDQQRFGLQGRQRKAVQNLLHLLDGTLLANHRHQSSWFELYRYCANALGIPEEDWVPFQGAKNVDELISNYKAAASEQIGKEVAELVFSNDSSAFSCFIRSVPIQSRPQKILQLAAARDYYLPDVGSYRAKDPLSILAVALEKTTNWRELFHKVQWLSQQPMTPTDSEMEALIKLMAHDGCLEVRTVLKLAIKLSKTRLYPRAYAALCGFLEAEDEQSPGNYNEIFGWLSLQMKLLKVKRLYQGLVAAH